MTSLEYLFGYERIDDENQAPVDLLSIVRPRRAQTDGPQFMMPIDGGSEYVTLAEYNLLGAQTPAEYTKRVPKAVCMQSWDNQRNRLTQWQRNFRELKELKLVVQASVCLGQTSREVLEVLPQNARILLRGISMEVEARVENCAWKSKRVGLDGQLCYDGECVRIVERAFR